MPIYEYACARCESEFEVEQRITDDPLKTCPKCQSKRVKRLISRTSFALKGGGWYADGYGSAKGGEKSESGDKADGDKAVASPAKETPSSNGGKKSKDKGGDKKAVA